MHAWGFVDIKEMTVLWTKTVKLLTFIFFTGFAFAIDYFCTIVVGGFFFFFFRTAVAYVAILA